MEKTQNRMVYMNAFREFSETVRLSENFMKKLKEHEYFKHTLHYINVSKYSIFFLQIEIYVIYNAYIKELHF
jgi:hypothetical protein